MRNLSLIVYMVLFCSCFLASADTFAQALPPRVAALEARMAALEARVDDLEAENAAQQAEIDDLRADLDGHTANPSAHHARYADTEAVAAVGPHYDDSALDLRVADIEEWGGFFELTTIDDGFGNALDTVRLSDANLQVVNGTGTTDGTQNGLGNVIVGYNEADVFGPVDRTGSHVFVAGRHLSYSSFGGIVVGFRNVISGDYSSVTGGNQGVASGIYSSVSGGLANEATNFAASVSGGAFNAANGERSSVSGGNSRSVAGIHQWRAGSLVEAN